MDKIFIDSDVCLDVLLKRQPFSIHSTQLLLKVENKLFKAVVSTLSFNNIFYVLRKEIGKQNAIAKSKKLRQIVSAGNVNELTLDSALNSGWNDFEDALQHFCAVEEKCQTIITRNIDDYKKSTLPFFTPVQFLKKQDR